MPLDKKHVKKSLQGKTNLADKHLPNKRQQLPRYLWLIRSLCVYVMSWTLTSLAKVASHAKL